MDGSLLLGLQAATQSRHEIVIRAFVIERQAKIHPLRVSPERDGELLASLVSRPFVYFRTEVKVVQPIFEILFRCGK